MKGNASPVFREERTGRWFRSLKRDRALEKTSNQGENMLSKVIIAAFLATSAVALEVKPVCSGPDHDRGCAATRQAVPATVRTLEIAGTSASHGDVRTNNVVG